MTTNADSTASAALKIEAIQLKKASLILRAVNHKLRQQLLKLIHQSGKITVTEIYSKMNLEQSVASQHLAILRKAGYVTTTREGKYVYYSVGYDRLSQLHRLVSELLNR